MAGMVGAFFNRICQQQPPIRTELSSYQRVEKWCEEVLNVFEPWAVTAERVSQNSHLGAGDQEKSIQTTRDMVLFPAGQLGYISTTAPSSWREGISLLCCLSREFNALSPVCWVKRQLWSFHWYSWLIGKTSQFNHLPSVAPHLGKTFLGMPGVTHITALLS